MFLRPPIRKSPLGVWIAENMPDLDVELGPMPITEVLGRLNKITGLSIPASAPINESNDRFLVELKRIHSKEPPCSAST